MASFAVAGALTGLAALLNAVRFNQIPSNAGLGLEMKVIAAVVVGGAAIRGGRGTLAGTLLGVVAARDRRSGADVPRRDGVLGARDAGRDHPRGGRGGRLAGAAGPRPALTASAGATIDDAPGLERWLPNGEWILALALVAEDRCSSPSIAQNFLTVANFFEVTRLSVELGLLAVALTPVIVSGGIDLSVGAMMGLAAVVFGAAVARLAPGDSDRGRRSRWRVGMRRRRAERAARSRGSTIPPLIVTLGSLSLFRGIAEGLTHGAVNYTDFPAVVPGARARAISAASFPRSCRSSSWSSRHTSCCCTDRSSAARSTRSASPPPARATPAFRSRGGSALVYVLSGLVASLAAIVYVAHLGQARSDAGTGYELDAITAVVLGGTSVFGGRGTLWGTLLGLFAVDRAAERPAAGRAAVGAGRRADRHAAARRRSPSIARGCAMSADARRRRGGDRREKQSGCRALRRHPRGLADRRRHERLAGAIARDRRVRRRRARPPPAPATQRPVIAMMPKAKGDPYFISCRAGAEEAAQELGVELIWDGPTEPRRRAPERAGRELDHARRGRDRGRGREPRRHLDRAAQGARARHQGADLGRRRRSRTRATSSSTRRRPKASPTTLTDEAARLLGGSGEFAIITGALSAANQNEWIAIIKKRLAEKYPDLKLATIRPSDDDRDKAFAETQTILRVYPDGQAGHGDLGAGRAWIGRSRPAGGADGRERDRPVAAEHQQAVRARRRRAGRRSCGTRATSAT